MITATRLAGLLHPAAFVGEDESGHPHPPPGEVEQQVRELDPAELEVREDGLDRAEGPGDVDSRMQGLHDQIPIVDRRPRARA
jgi:hypothetical protein